MEKWREVSEDYSFTPLTHAEAEIKEAQANVIIAQSQAHLSPVVYRILSEGLPSNAEGKIKRCQEFLKKYSAHHKNAPDMEMQHAQQEKSESIINYLKTEVTQHRHSWLEEQQIAHIMKDRSPYDALKTWQKVSEDYSFKPLTNVEAQIKEVQANEILEKAKTQLIPALYERLERNLPTYSEGIIQKCQEALVSHVEKQRDLDIHRFKSLCERYNEVEGKESSSSPRMQNIEQGLREIMTRYKSDEKFMRTIERSHDKNIQKIAEIFKSQDLTKEQSEVSRGFER